MLLSPVPPLNPSTHITPALPLFGSQRYMKHYADFFLHLFLVKARLRLRRGFGRNERWNTRDSLLTLSTAASERIPWLYFNRCSTTRIRQGDLAVLFPAAHAAYLCMRYANESSLAQPCLPLLRAVPSFHLPQTQAFSFQERVSVQAPFGGRTGKTSIGRRGCWPLPGPRGGLVQQGGQIGVQPRVFRLIWTIDFALTSCLF